MDEPRPADTPWSLSVDQAPAAPAAPLAWRVQAPWSVRLLGAVAADSGGQVLSHWPSRAVACLLARLALEPDRVHPREELVDLLWPGVGLAVGRARLRQVLSTLKAQLQPARPGVLPVIRADRAAVRVVPGMLVCDALQFEQALQAGQPAQALAWYRGELMPGFYDDWVQQARHRLAALRDTLGELAGLPQGPDHRAAEPAAAVHLGASARALPVGGLGDLRRPDEPARQPPAGTPALALSLPAYWSSAFGLADRLARLQALVVSRRLVTILGVGGSGKTRLAVAAAQQWQADPTALGVAQVVFVAAANCADTDALVDAIGHALGLAGGSVSCPALTSTLGWRHTLLVLDNLEQLPPDAQQALVEALAGVPGLRLLVTSRRRVGVPGEQVMVLDGLALPPAEPSLAQAAQSPAVALFVDRARATRPEFHLHAGNVRQVAALVRWLQGLPLPIELAASRLRVLSVGQLLAHLQAGQGSPALDLLVRSSAGASVDSRHASMRSTMAWSWRLLPAPQARLLAQLSVLVAPARAEAVAALAGLPIAQALQPLEGLVDASMLRAHLGPDGLMRHDLLPPVREWAAEQLSAADTALARRRLRDWLLVQAAAVGGSGGRPLAALQPELQQVFAALQRPAQDPADALASLQLACLLRPHWDLQDLPLAALQALEAALRAVPGNALPPDLHAEALELLAHGRHASGYPALALAHAEAACAVPCAARPRCLALLRWIRLANGAGRLAGVFEPALDEAQALAECSGDRHAQAEVLRLRASVAGSHGGQLALAEALSAQAQPLWEQLGNTTMVYNTRLSRALWAAHAGRAEQAWPVAADCERRFLADGDALRAAFAACQLGRIHLLARQWVAAEAALLRSLRLAWDRRLRLALARALLHLPMAGAAGPQPDTAARLLGFAQAHWAAQRGPLDSLESRALQRTRRLLRQRLGPTRWESLRVQGAADSLEAVVPALLQRAV